MIIKSFEINKKKFDNKNFFLIYGDNEGLKTEIIQIIRKDLKGSAKTYDEAQVLNDCSLFYENVFNQSLFEKEKVIIVNRCSEKIFEVIENIIEKENQDIKIILNANILDSRSKLRKLFEKNNQLIVIPTYKDNTISLVEIAKKFFYNYKISISQETINLLVNRSSGDRGNLKSELDKIQVYIQDRKSIKIN